MTSGRSCPRLCPVSKCLSMDKATQFLELALNAAPLYAPLLTWDLRIGNQLYIQIGNPVPEGASVQVLNDGMLWPTNMIFAASADPLRFSPAIHVNQEGYMTTTRKKRRLGTISAIWKKCQYRPAHFSSLLPIRG